MIVSTDTLPGVIDTKNAPFIDVDMPNEAYHAEKHHISRSTAHRYADDDMGGRSQRYAEQGGSLFGGNSSTGFGTIVDVACGAEMRGVDWRSQVAVPPDNVLASDGSRRGKAYQEWKATLPAGFCECNATDYAKVQDIIASIYEHDAAKALVEAATHSQYSVFWTDSDGHARKARADGVTPRGWFDLKTTSSEWRDLKWSFLRFGYDWQAVWYADAARVAGFEPFDFPFIVVQTFAPFNVKVVTLPGDVLARAADEIKRTLDAIRTRRETGIYVPASYHAVQELVF
jgi:hypothetical protein